MREFNRIPRVHASMPVRSEHVENVHRKYKFGIHFMNWMNLVHFMNVWSTTEGRLANYDIVLVNSGGQVTLAGRSPDDDTASTIEGLIENCQKPLHLKSLV